jgi:hypothetical protein
VPSLVDDLVDGVIVDPPRDRASLAGLLAEGAVVDYDGRGRIDQRERTRGEAERRRRVKLTRIEDMLDLALSGSE